MIVTQHFVPPFRDVPERLPEKVRGGGIRRLVDLVRQAQGIACDAINLLNAPTPKLTRAFSFLDTLDTLS